MSANPLFLDTNILVYGYTGQDDIKRDIANALISGGQAMVSTQVLNEFCNTLRRNFPSNFCGRTLHWKNWPLVCLLPL